MAEYTETEQGSGVRARGDPRPGRRRRIVAALAALACLLIAGALFLARAGLIGTLSDQNAAQRWAGENPEGNKYVQLSVFLPGGSTLSLSALEEVRHSIEAALSEASAESADGKTRTWIDAACFETEAAVGLTGNTGSVRAYVTSGDYFFFHPQKMLSGWNYSERDLMEDGVVINRALAWELYGGYNLAGMPVNVGGQPCVIVGVTDGPEGEGEREAFGTDSAVWFSARLAEKLGIAVDFTSFDAVLPEPIRDFGENVLREQFGEKDRIFVRESGRFGFLRSLQTVRDFDSLVQRRDAIPYPYSENAALAVQSRCALITCLIVLLLLFPAGFAAAEAVRGVLFVKNLHPLRFIPDYFERKKTERYEKKRREKREKEELEEKAK